MKLQFYLNTPVTYGDVVINYLKVLEENVLYDAWTITNDLEVIPCKGSIRNNGSWNHHNNYDNSENELYVTLGSLNPVKQWFSLNKTDVLKTQTENIEKWLDILNKEQSRLNDITK